MSKSGLRLRLGRRAALFGALALPAVAKAATGVPVPVKTGPVASAHGFLDSVGIGAHWEQKASVYGARKDTLVREIMALGVRHVRGFDPNISPVLARHGITASMVTGPEFGDPAAILAIVRRANRAGMVIDAVEGPNEADLFWPMHGYRFAGEGFPAGVIAYQRALFAAIKGSDQAHVVVIGPSLGKTYDPSGDAPNPLPRGSLADAVDLGNFHPYPFGGNSFSAPFAYDGIARYYWSGNIPSGNLDEFPYAWEVYAPPFAPRPMAATETGYPTWADGVSEDVQARYIPRLLAEYFRLGIHRTYLYELADDRPDPGGQTMDDHFGLLRNDGTRKPAFTALRSLLTLIDAAIAGPRMKGPRITGPRITPDAAGSPPVIALEARMPPGYDRASFVHSLVLRASEDHALLLVWHEIADADTASKPSRRIEVPDGGIDVTVAAPYVADAWYAYDGGWELQGRSVAASRSLSVPLQDRIVVVSLRREHAA